MIRKLAAVLNVFFLLTFVYLIFFDGNVKGIFNLLLPILVLTTPVVNLYALNFLDIRKVNRIIKSKLFRHCALASIVVITLGSTVLMFQGKDSEIYVAAFSNLIGKDDTYGGELNPKIIYVSKDIYSDPFSGEIDGTLPVDVINELSNYANEKGLDLRFFDSNSPLEYNDLGEIKSGGVQVNFGKLNKYMLFSEIEGSIYIASLASGGTSYKLYRWFGGWKLYSSQMAWIS